MTLRSLTGFAALLVVTAAGCNKKAPPPAAAPATTQAPAPEPAPSGGGNTNYQAGAGAVQNVRQAARRTVAINDMDQLGKFMQQMSAETGKLPSAKEVKDYIKRDAPKVVAAIDDGSIILTGTKNMTGLWAYEVDADTQGGIALVGGTASRMDAAQVKQLIAQK